MAKQEIPGGTAGRLPLTVISQANAGAEDRTCPDDDVVIGTALAAKANLIVTGDLPLLSVIEYQRVRLCQVSEVLLVISR